MKKFMAMFTGTQTGSNASRWQSMHPEEQQHQMLLGMQAWQAWMETHAAAILDIGGPLGKTKLINHDGIVDTSNALSAYVIVSAADHEAAAAMFIDHPHFRYFPGDGVEVMECMPVPGQPQE